MNINQLRKGILISKRAENKNADRIYFELGRWSIGSKNIKLYPKIVFGFSPSGRYMGATHYETPYTYSLDEFAKRFYPTGIATTRRIRKLFIDSGCHIDYMPPHQIGVLLSLCRTYLSPLVEMKSPASHYTDGARI